MTEIDELRRELSLLRTEVAALRGRPAPPPAGAPDEVSRRGLLGKLAGAAVAGAGLSMLGSAPAEATAGNPVILGASGTTNDSGTSGTYVKATTSVEHAFDVTQQGTGIALGVDITDTTTSNPALWIRHNGHGSAIDAATFDQFGTPAIYGSGGTGVQGHDLNGGGTGVLGDSEHGIGVYGYTDDGRGTYGYANSGSALYGYAGSGYGLTAFGGRAPLYLNPGATAGPPTTGSHQRGEVWVDANGLHWHCVATGTPGTWVRPGFNAVTPYRLLSGSTATGTFATGTRRDLQVTGSHGIPASMVAVAVNLSVTSTGTGSITAYKAGTTRPGIAQVAYGPAYKWSGFAIVPLSATGKISVYASAGTTHVSVDVSGFFA
jgi:hypothetical protein